MKLEERCMYIEVNEELINGLIGYGILYLIEKLLKQLWEAETMPLLWKL